MVDRSGRVRLMDFGLAKQRIAAEGAVATAIGQVMGTPEFMSPEQVRGERADFPSDIYAMGIVFYEMFTGEVPFKGSAAETMVNHVHKPVPFDGPVGIAHPAHPRAGPAAGAGQGAGGPLRDRARNGHAPSATPRRPRSPETAPTAAPRTPAAHERPPPRRRPSPRWPPSSPRASPCPAPTASRGPDLQMEVQALIGALRDADPTARRRAAQALGECGPAAREAVGPLITALSDPDFWVSETAALALRKITGAPDPAVGTRPPRRATSRAPLRPRWRGC